MLKSWFSLIAISLIWIAGRFQQLEVEVFNEVSSVQEVLLQLGEPMPDHYIQADPELAKKGEELVTTGRSRKANDHKARYINKYDSSTTCYNLEP